MQQEIHTQGYAVPGKSSQTYIIATAFLSLFAIIFGIGLGGDYMIIPLMAGDLFGIKTLGRIMGIILVADGLAESLLPMLVGALYKMNNSYTLGFSLLIVLAVGGAVVVSFLGKKSEV
jgi:MFS family permease